ncbi:MAG: ATP-binding cassette domain-containing protein [Burkholderiales bacterium]
MPARSARAETSINVVTVTRVDKTHHLDAVDVPALVGIDLEIRPNCFTVISGPSGSGKTTLLNLIGCIDQPNRGELVVAGQAVQTLSDDALSDFRARHLGFISQNFNLLPVLTIEEKVEYPLLLARVPAAERNRRRSLTTLVAMVIGAVTILVFGGYARNIVLSLHTSYVLRGGYLQIQRNDYFLYGSGNPAAKLWQKPALDQILCIAS